MLRYNNFILLEMKTNASNIVENTTDVNDELLSSSALNSEISSNITNDLVLENNFQELSVLSSNETVIDNFEIPEVANAFLDSNEQVRILEFNEPPLNQINTCDQDLFSQGIKVVYVATSPLNTHISGWYKHLQLILYEF